MNTRCFIISLIAAIIYLVCLMTYDARADSTIVELDTTQINTNPLLVTGNRGELNITYTHDGLNISGDPETLKHFDLYYAPIDSANQMHYNFIYAGRVMVPDSLNQRRWNDPELPPDLFSFTYTLTDIAYNRIIFAVVAEDMSKNRSLAALSNYRSAMGEGFVYVKDNIPPSMPNIYGIPGVNSN